MTQEADHLSPTTVRQATCDFCHLKPRCLPDHLLMGEAGRALQNLIISTPPRPRGSMLYREGDARTAYFFIRAGSAKAFVVDEQGTECVTGFYLPTDLIGASSLEHPRFTESVVLLERSSVCQLPAAALEEFCRRDQALYHRFIGKIADTFDTERHARLRLNHASADERVADFLAEFSTRMAALGHAPDEFSLSMSRYDIANYLGLAAETVSRSLRRLQEDGILAVRGRQLRILARPALIALREGGARA